MAGATRLKYSTNSQSSKTK